MKQHTVAVVKEDECIGCKLCIPPCPVDCIEMIDAVTAKPTPELVKYRNKNRKLRLAKEEEMLHAMNQDNDAKKRYILEVIARKRNERC